MARLPCPSGPKIKTCDTIVANALHNAQPRGGARGDHDMALVNLTPKLMGAVALLAVAVAASGSAEAQTKVRYGTNWLAQAEHGGYYQAVADGTYKACGLDVEIVQGGPQSNNRMLLPTGGIDFYMGGNMLQAFSAVEQGIPTVVVAASFQKEPQVIIAHPDQGIEKFEDLKKLTTIFVSKEGFATYYQWMMSAFGFTAEQTKPYTFTAAPFLADKRSAMQGYLSSEPYAIEKQAGFKPKVFLIADSGFDTYSTTIETRRDLVEKQPKVVECFVNGSAIGWYNYLHGDNKAANAMIKKDNPEMTDDAIAFAIAAMKANGIVESGEALTAGIGAMTDARQKSFFDKMVKAGVVKANVDYTKAYTLQFVNKGVGLDVRKKLTGN
jgi:NitT/TauT family transport system substrate-binding protein